MHARSVPFLLVALTLLGLTSLTATRASAQASTGELRDGETTARVAGELGVFSYDEGGVDFVVAQPSVYGSFRLADFGGGAFLDVDAAWRFVGVMGDASAFRAGNPYVGLRAGVHDTRDGWRLRGGVGATAPLMNAYDDYANPGDFAGVLAVGMGAAMQGSWDQWLMRPLTSSIVVRGDFEHRQRYFDLGAEIGLAAMLPVEYRGDTGTGAWLAQGGVWAAGRPIEQLAIGARVQAVMTHPMNDIGNAEGFVALMPFVRGELGVGFIEARWMLNLDEPLGPWFENDGVWGAYVTGGASF